MSKNQKLLQKKRKEFGLMNALLLIIGSGLLIAGANRLFFGETEFVVNAFYLQPVVENGALQLLVGTVLIACLLYRVINRKKVVNQLLEMEAEEELEFRKSIKRK